MKVVLIVPPNPLQKFTWTETYHYPLGLLYLASYLQKHGIDVKVLDCIAEKLGYKEFAKEIEDCSVVGLTAVTSTYNQADKCLQIAKKMGKTTIIGGVHSTALPMESIVKPWIDYVVIGEGEYTMLELLQNLQNSNFIEVKGIAFKNEGKLIINRRRPLIDDLDSLPHPALDLIDFPNSKKYHVSTIFAKRSPVGNVITSRGCPYNCLYCGTKSFWTQRVRYRSVENVIEELKILKDSYTVREIKFWDDTFTLDKKRVVKICQAMVKEKLDFTWSCLTRVDHLREDMLKWMKKAGCWEVDFGIDSGNQKMLDNLNKQTTLGDTIKGVRMVKEAGIEAKGNLVFGTPEETPKTIRDSIEFVKKLDLDYLNVCIMCPIPNSGIYEIAVENGWIFDWDWSHYTARVPVMNIGTVTPEYLSKMQRQCLKEFYRRPSFILKRLLRLKSYDEFRRAFVYAISVWRGLD